MHVCVTQTISGEKRKGQRRRGRPPMGWECGRSEGGATVPSNSRCVRARHVATLGNHSDDCVIFSFVPDWHGFVYSYLDWGGWCPILLMGKLSFVIWTIYNMLIFWNGNSFCDDCGWVPICGRGTHLHTIKYPA